MIPKLLVAAALGAVLAMPQDKQFAPPGSEAAIIPVKTLSGDAFNRLAKMLEVFGVPYKADDKLRTIVVYGPKDVVAQMRAVVEQLDRPGSEAAIGRNIDMTLSFLICPAKEASAAQPVPPDLEPVARQLRAAGLCKDAALLDTLLLRLQEGKDAGQAAVLSGLSKNAATQVATVNLHLIPEAIVRKESDRYVRFAAANISFRVPNGPEVMSGFRELILKTAGDFKEGQKTVLGKVSGVDQDSSLFAVVSLKILD